jgi:phage-related protein
MKSAWTNLLTGLADGNADIGQLVDNLVTTIVGDGTEGNLGVLGNIMPAVKMALKGAAKVVAQSAPIIAEELPKLMEEILPDLASATANLIVALAEQIPSMAQTLVDAAYEIVDEIGNAFAERIPGLSTIFENLETVVISLTAAFGAYKLAMAISGIIDTLRKATEGQTLAQTLLNAVMNANPFVLIATLIAGLVAAIITLWNTNDDFKNALIGAWDAIKNAAVVVWESIVKFFETNEQPVAKKETLAVLAIRDAIMKGVNGCGKTIPVERY